jgi:hypothetical protein
VLIFDLLRVLLDDIRIPLGSREELGRPAERERERERVRERERIFVCVCVRKR